MSTDWTVFLADGTTIQVQADDLTTRDGALWLLVSDGPPPGKLRPVLILARGRWHAVHPADTEPSPMPAAQRPASTPEPPTPPERRFA